MAAALDPPLPLPAAERVAPSRRLRLPLKHVIAAIVVTAMLLLGVTVVVLGQIAARQTVLMTTAERLQDAGRLITEQTGRMLEPARATLLQLSFDPLTAATDVEARLLRAFVLIEPLVANKLLSSLYVGSTNGDFVLARRIDSQSVRALVAAPERAAFLLQSVSGGVEGQARTGEYIFYDAALRIVERRAQPAYRFDPRTRPWYLEALNGSGAILSRPYVFFTTRQVGVSLSQQSRDGRAVVSVDVVLDDLAEHLAGMRFTPGTELALVDTERRVLAYPDMGRVLLRESDERFGFRTLETLGVDSLRQMSALPKITGASGREARQFQSGGIDWIGVAMPFRFDSAEGMQLLVAAPVDELAMALNGQQTRMLQIILLVALAMLPFGWWAGKRIGQSMDQLIARASRVARFDLSPQGPMAATWVREVDELAIVMDGMVETIDHFLQIGRQLSTETDMERMLSTVLQQVVETTRCAAGAVYLWQHGDNTMLRAAQTVTAPDGLPMRLQRHSGAQAGRWLVEPAAPGLAQVELELRGRNGQLQGLLVLRHRADAAHADAAFAEFTERLSGMLAVSIETHQLVDAQKKLLDAVIRLMADAIDAKSPYTGGHCERVPQLAIQMVERMHEDTEGPYRDFAMSADERYAFYLGAWLHDCGKVTSPEHIVDKATKLELIYNRVHEVRMRFEVLWRDAEAAHLRRQLAGEPEAESLAQMRAQQQCLTDDFAFIARCNIGGEFLADDTIERLHRIGAQTWLRHFDDRLGLSAGELHQQRPAGGEARQALPAVERLLADRPEHLVEWGESRPPVEKGDPRNRYGFDMTLPPVQQNMGELHNLSIRRGTLTQEDRFKINDHVVQTYVMLKNLPWPPHLSQVPEIAATHHEKMDGRGYPRRLGADRLTVFDRVMAVADIFEALTAADRPYKAPKTLSESLRIMAVMCRDRHLDTSLFRYFLRSDVWRDFARRNMQPSQIDEVDLAALEKLLPDECAADAAAIA